MKKFLIVVMVLALTLTGCETTRKSYEDKEKIEYGRFRVIEGYKSDFGVTFVTYDTETKVMYYIIDGYQRSGITPIYNADGTVKVYEGE